ncbi:MAG: hypothetical protein PUE93_06080 [Acidaminococcus sp.]|nr:hypothetical protein [Acidaminococcus sp.]
MEIQKQQNPFAGTGPSRPAAQPAAEQNVTRHGFPAWDLVPLRPPVRKENEP